MAAEEVCSGGTAAFVTEPEFAQLFRKLLQKEGILDRHYRVQKLPDGTVALPVLGQGLKEQQLQELKERIPPGKTCVLSWIQNPILSKAAKVQSPVQKLHDELQRFISTSGATWSEEME
nr:PREDICTED: tRNA wybutosine-synthesizing protein 2 homolog [Anolis carolinensis]|eukprot:XP_016849713.1 PREDICTED: tRNA wybutosine-synthesizing protein 2 homolog [Anolis carolinensis]